MTKGNYAVIGLVNRKNKVVGLAAGRWFIRRLTAREKQQVMAQRDSRR